MKSYDLISELEKGYNEKGYNSHDSIDILKKEGIIDNDINNSFIPDFLRVDISDFLDVLLNFNPYIMRQKLILEKMYKNNMNYNAEYILCNYLNDKNAYRNTPKELYDIVHKVNIDEYKYITSGDITGKFYRYLDVSDGFDSRRNYYTCEMIFKYSPKKELYDKYASLYNPYSVVVNDRNNFYIWAENAAYNYELEKNKDLNMDDKVLWVSRYYGDGYGFDILSINKETNREKLIEVKSGMTKECSLTENEANVMRNCKYKNCDYYVYRYYYKENNNSEEKVRIIIYEYLPDLDLMVDEDNNLYSINEYFGLNDNGNKVKLFGIIPNGLKYDKNNKILTLKNTN